MTGRRGAPGGRLGRWTVDHRVGPAADLHGPWPPPGADDVPRIAVCHVTPPGALVLGSGQRWTAAGGGGSAGEGAPTAAGLPVVRRRGGGGAVVVRPDRQVWIDVWLPRGDRLWDDDVVAAAGWLGRAWARALTDVGVAAAVVHRGRLTERGEAAAVCFAALGPGEVLGGRPPRKVVGVSQHRSRRGARFLTMALTRWHPAATVDALVEVGLVTGDTTALTEVVADRAAGLCDLGADAGEPGALGPGAIVPAVERAAVLCIADR